MFLVGPLLIGKIRRFIKIRWLFEKTAVFLSFLRPRTPTGFRLSPFFLLYYSSLWNTGWLATLLRVLNSGCSKNLLKSLFHFFFHYDFTDFNIKKGIDSTGGNKKKKYVFFFISRRPVYDKKMEKSRILSVFSDLGFLGCLLFSWECKHGLRWWTNF